MVHHPLKWLNQCHVRRSCIDRGSWFRPLSFQLTVTWYHPWKQYTRHCIVSCLLYSSNHIISLLLIYIMSSYSSYILNILISLLINICGKEPQKINNVMFLLTFANIMSSPIWIERMRVQIIILSFCMEAIVQ